MTSSAPVLLRIPEHIRSVEDALAIAGKLQLGNVVILSETPDGLLFFATSAEGPLSGAETLWLLKSAEHLLFPPMERLDAQNSVIGIGPDPDNAA